MEEKIPKLIYLVGLPGSGKSYYAKSLFKRTDNELDEEFSSCVYLSSDELRKEYYGDESCQDNPAFIFEQMRQRTIHELEHGRDVIYDATNVNRKKRIQFLNSLPKNLDCYKICTVVWARLDTCIERDKNRERTVGENVIMKICKQFQTPWEDEGWDSVHLIINDDRKYLFKDFNLDIPHDNPHHPNTIKHHTANVVREVLRLDAADIGGEDKQKLYFTALLHDIGKIYTKSFVNSKGETTDIAHYYDHQNVSAYLALGMQTWVCNEEALEISYLCNMHMEPFFNESKYFKNMDPKLKKLVLAFNECDKRGA